MRTLNWAVIAACCLTVVGCAAKIQRVDDKLLADAPLYDRAAMVNADQERARAADDVRRFESELSTGSAELETAKAELGQREAELRRDQAELDVAKSKKDDVAKARAERQIEVSKAAVKAAEARVDYAEARKDYLTKNLEAGRLNAQWTDSGFELEKAKLLQRTGRAPADFTLLKFEEQENNAHRDLLSAKKDVASAEKSMREAEQDFEKRQTTLHEVRAKMATE